MAYVIDVNIDHIQEQRLPVLSQACTMMLPSSVNMNVNPGGLPSFSKTGLGMWHRLVLVWTLGATDTENLVDPFVHLAMYRVCVGRI